MDAKYKIKIIISIAIVTLLGILAWGHRGIMNDKKKSKVESLKVGEMAPDFSAHDQTGKLIHLSDYRGHYVLLYFYPKDETPGCTTEAKNFRDHFAQFKKFNTVILGVSRQGEKSHQEFIHHHKLPFDLLVDKDAKIGHEYGVGNLLPLFNLSQRQSILIGPDGKIIAFYRHVNPATHAEEVLRKLDSLAKNSRP